VTAVPKDRLETVLPADQRENGKATGLDNQASRPVEKKGTELAIAAKKVRVLAYADQLTISRSK
jgi:hypothetical protein